MITLPAGDPRNKIEYLAELVSKLGAAPINLLNNALFRFILRSPDSRTMIFPDVGGFGDNLLAEKSPAPNSMTTFDRWEFFVTHPEHSALVRQFEEGVARIGIMADEVATQKIWQFCQSVPIECAVVNQLLSLGVDLRNATVTGGAYRVYVEAFDAGRTAHRVFERDVLPNENWQAVRASFQLADPADNTKPFKGMLRFGVEMLRPNAEFHTGDELDVRHPFLSAGDVEAMPAYNAVSDFAQISTFTRSVRDGRISGVICENGVIETQAIGADLISLRGAPSQSNFYPMSHPNVVIDFMKIICSDESISIHGSGAVLVSEGGQATEVSGAVANIQSSTANGGVSFKLNVPSLAGKVGQPVWIDVNYYVDAELKSAGFELES